MAAVGNAPGGYHVTSLILQILESLLIWIILRRLSIPGAFLAALIFAVHPVNVESVAWIAQLKEHVGIVVFPVVDFVVFEGVTAEQRTVGSEAAGHLSSFIPHAGMWYWLSLAAFVLAMLGKGSAAVLPVLLLVNRVVAAAWQDVISCERPRFS